MTNQEIERIRLEWRLIKVLVDDFCSKIERFLEKASTDYDFHLTLNKNINKLIKSIDNLDSNDGIELVGVIDEMQDFKFKLRNLQRDLQNNKPIDNAPWYKRVVRGIF
jgi:hypothetical protein